MRNYKTKELEVVNHIKNILRLFMYFYKRIQCVIFNIKPDIFLDLCRHYY